MRAIKRTTKKRLSKRRQEARMFLVAWAGDSNRWSAYGVHGRDWKYARDYTRSLAGLASVPVSLRRDLDPSVIYI